MKRTILFTSIVLTAITLATVVGIVKAVQNFSQTGTPAASETASSAAMPINLPTQAAPTAYTPTLAADQAAQVALAAAGEGADLASTPILVSFNGSTAYEVTLIDGSKLYIDAASGILLYNSLTGDATAAIDSLRATQIATSYFGGGELYGVDRGLFDNKIGYAVYFWNGNVAFVDMRGNVLYGQIANHDQNTPNTAVGEESDDHD